MKIVVDSREQRPYSFPCQRYADTETTRGTLQAGDYSLAGLEDKVAVERKSLDDLVQCLGRERSRFERELVRGQGMDAFAVIVEADWAKIAKGEYHSRMAPQAAMQSILAFQGRYGTPFIFAGCRAGGEYACHGFLKQYLEGARKRFNAIVKAHGDC